jgi:hypothetical protein
VSSTALIENHHGNRIDQINASGRARLKSAPDSVSVPLTLLAKNILRHSGRMLDPDAAMRPVAPPALEQLARRGQVQVNVHRVRHRELDRPKSVFRHRAWRMRARPAQESAALASGGTVPIPFCVPYARLHSGLGRISFSRMLCGTFQYGLNSM